MLQIEDITYGYSSRNVIEHLTLNYTEPGIYGLLGRNGSGKSTLLYLIMGLLHPKSGRVLIDGIDTKERHPEVMSQMFIVPEEYDLPRVMLGDYIRTIRPFYPDFDSGLMVNLLDMFELSSVNGATLDTDGIPTIHLGALSMGQKKKVYMCIALATRTRLLIMDEPTNGLDIPSKSQFRKVIAHGTREDQTIIISTHQVRDVEMMLDHITIIDNNRVLMNAPINMEEPVNLEELFIQLVTKAEMRQ